MNKKKKEKKLENATIVALVVSRAHFNGECLYGLIILNFALITSVCAWGVVSSDTVINSRVQLTDNNNKILLYTHTNTHI